MPQMTVRTGAFLSARICRAEFPSSLTRTTLPGPEPTPHDEEKRYEHTKSRNHRGNTPGNKFGKRKYAHRVMRYDAKQRVILRFVEVGDDSRQRPVADFQRASLVVAGVTSSRTPWSAAS